DEATIDELTTREPVQAAGAALLQLAIAHRGLLLSGLLRGLPAPLAHHAFVPPWDALMMSGEAGSGALRTWAENTHPGRAEWGYLLRARWS
ncbi:MAG: hypothetical protein WBF20_14305, partial [Trebonia sp.]